MREIRTLSKLFFRKYLDAGAGSKMHELFYYLLLIFFTGLTLGAWQDGIPVNSYLTREKLSERFLGRFSNHEEDHLLLLSWNTESLLIGARDALFNLTSRDLNLNSILNWTVSEDHQDMCQVKGQKDSDCRNFIRVFHGPIHHHHSHSSNGGSSSNGSGGNENMTEYKENNTKSEEMSEKWIICGTNAFKPQCRLYDETLGNFSHEISGVGYSPFDPTHMSTSVLHHGAVYAATVADFGGIDSLIYKNPLRTEQNDPRHLSNPSFVSSLSHGDLALFFFRELAVEHTNCGKVVYSRVARLCRHDTGSRKHKDRFTTFLKARLNCSVPGEFPFYFDHIQGTSSVFLDSGRSIEMLYAVFTTPDNSIGASAVCSFSLSDILKVFDGPFKGQSSYESNWLPVSSNDVPSPRPGACHPDPTYLPDSASIAFHKAHPLMDEAVQGTLALVYASNTDRFRVITVDHSPEVDLSRASASYHVLYIGTDSGKILKAVVDNNRQNVSRQRRHEDTDEEKYSTSASPDDPPTMFTLNSSLISASWQVADKPIKTLRLINPRTLLVGTETEIFLIPIHHCGEYKTCHQCIKLRDPHCYWDMNNEACVSMETIGGVNGGQYDLRQDIQNGDDQFCPQVMKKQPVEVTVEPVHPESNEILSQNVKRDGEECCSCVTTTTMSPQIGTNRIPELDDHFRYIGGSHDYDDRAITFAEMDPSIDNFPNRIPKMTRKDYESSSVQSGEESTIGRGSIVMATVGSTLLSLLIGFFIGFIGSKWLAKKKKSTKTAATNAQLAASINEQSQRLTAKPIDFVVNVTNCNGTLNKNPLKNNLNTDTLEKTVKKIYL